jgi:hypothetical protein
MIVTYKEIKQRIQDKWPNCRNVWLSDPEYEYPVDKQSVYDLVLKSGVKEFPFENYTFDCDDFALQLSAYVSRATGIDSSIKAPHPFGQVKGRKFRGKVEFHNINICLLENQILLIEPQTYEIWAGSSINDQPFFVSMP